MTLIAVITDFWVEACLSHQCYKALPPIFIVRQDDWYHFKEVKISVGKVKVALKWCNFKLIK